MRQSIAWVAALILLCSFSAYSELTYKNQFMSPENIDTRVVLRAFVDDGTVVNVEELVRFDGSPNTSTGNNGHWLVQGTTIGGQHVNILPEFGGYLQIDWISVRLGGGNTGATSECDWNVQMTQDGTNTTVAHGTKGAAAGWTLCTGELETGLNSSNAGKNGRGDSEVDSGGEQYFLRLTDCTCTDLDCKANVVVSDRVASSTQCSEINDANVAIGKHENF